MTGLEYVIFVTGTPKKEVAQELEVSVQIITKWVQRLKPIAKKHIPKLVKKFGISEEYFQKELSLQDKIEIELQLASKSGAYENIDHQAAILHKQNQAVKDKYSSLLGSVQQYTINLLEIEENAELIQSELINLIKDETVIADPEACEKIFGLLKNIQTIRKRAKTL